MKSYIYFGAGFVLSTVLAVLAFGLSTIFWYAYPITEPAKTTTPKTSQNSTYPPCEKRIVGYYSGWEYREITENQLSKLTHVIFAFVELNSSRTFAFENEAKETLFIRMKEKAKKAGVKVMFSTGWISQTDNYSKLLIDSEKRRIFIDSLLYFINTHHIDGVDFHFDWVDDQNDMANDVITMKEIRNNLRKAAKWRRREPYIISIKTPSTKLKSENEIYLDALFNYVDFVNVPYANYFENWKVEHGVFNGLPLTLHTGVSQDKSIDKKMKYICCTSRRPNQLNIEVIFYRICWTNATSGSYLPWRNLNSIGWKSRIINYTEN